MLDTRAILIPTDEVRRIPEFNPLFELFVPVWPCRRFQRSVFRIDKFSQDWFIPIIGTVQPCQKLTAIGGIQLDVNHVAIPIYQFPESLIDSMKELGGPEIAFQPISVLNGHSVPDQVLPTRRSGIPHANRSVLIRLEPALSDLPRGVQGWRKRQWQF